jgi:hypothetical protein
LFIVAPHDHGGLAADPARMLALEILHVNKARQGRAEAQGFADSGMPP